MFSDWRQWTTPVCLAVFCWPLQSLLALTNNLALTPQMGWNDWNSYGCGISEAAVTNTANLMASNGMKAAGYQFVNIDDGWAGSRDTYGVIQAYSVSGKFPHGIKWLADYVHGKGLKLGLYTDHGTNTCSSCISKTINPVGKQPGSFGYEYVDAFTYAAWGADYLKNDSCNLPAGDVPYEDYFRMADGLMKSGRPVFNSLCPNAAHYEYWSPDVGNSWRTTGDIRATFASMISKIDQNSRSAYLAGPGRWNDPDMLEIGNGEFATNLVAAQTHFTMWCIMAAPLIAGNNLAAMSPPTLEILTNAEAIAVDQDPAGEQGEFVGGVRGSAEVWSKPLGYDFTTRAVALLNRSATNSATITCYWTNLAFQAGTTATVRDLWAHQDLGAFTNSFSATIPPYGSRLLKIAGTPLPPPGWGTNYLSDLPAIYAYTGWGTQTKNRSIGGNPLTLDGVVYTNGIGTHAIGGQEYNLGGVCSRFHAVVGVDDEVGGNGSVIFQVFADGRKIYDSGILTGGAPVRTIDLDLTGVRRLTIGVTDTGNDVTGNRNAYDHADWADAYVVVTNLTPRTPEAPTGLAAGPGNTIKLSWDDTLAAIAYNVKRSTLSGSGYLVIATNIPLTTFTDSNVVTGTTYYYVVSAVSSFGEGADSTEVAATPCLPPAVPTGVAAASTNSQITVSWNASAGAASYTVSRFTGSTPPVVVAAGVTGTNFTDTNVLVGVVYYYLVAADNGCGQSDDAAFVPAATPTLPLAPDGLSAFAGDAAVFLSWSPAAGADSYHVKRATAVGGPYTTIASPTTVWFTDTNVANGQTYFYVVSAVNAVGESADSAPVSVTPAALSSTNLVAWLTFDDGTAGDASGYGNNGVLVGGASVVTDAQRGRVLLLDGVSGYVDLGNAASLNLSLSGQATIAAWVKVALTHNHNTILSKGEWKDAYSLLVKGDTSPPNLLWTGNDTSVFSADAVPLNEWTHVAVTINGSLTSFYLNGQLSGATNQNRGNPIDQTTNDVCLGREQYSGSLPAGRWFFNGELDDVRIYNRALTAGEIQGVMRSGLGGLPQMSGATLRDGNFVFSGSNGVANAVYYVLATTNAAWPLSQWPVIATNTFDAGGNFRFTNAPDPNWPQAFYLLKLQ